MKFEAKMSPEKIIFLNFPGEGESNSALLACRLQVEEKARPIGLPNDKSVHREKISIELFVFGITAYQSADFASFDREMMFY